MRETIEALERMGYSFTLDGDHARLRFTESGEPPEAAWPLIAKLKANRDAALAVLSEREAKSVAVLTKCCNDPTATLSYTEDGKESNAPNEPDSTATLQHSPELRSAPEEKCCGGPLQHSSNGATLQGGSEAWFIDGAGCRLDRVIILDVRTVNGENWARTVGADLAWTNAAYLRPIQERKEAS